MNIADNAPRGTNPSPRSAADEATLFPDDPRVIQAAQEYLAAIEAGQRVNRRQFIARHREIAGALADCLDALDFVHGAAPQLEGRESSQAAGPITSSAALDLATPLGDFRILREIGRGGMGVVYEAEQLSLGRRIALKVLPFASTLDPRQLQRFKNEAQAAAQLHHSNIVPVYAVGCDRGVHYYAMQFIEGQTLAALIQGLRQQAGLAANPAPLSSAPGRQVADKLPATGPDLMGPSSAAPSKSAPPAADTGRPLAAAVSTERWSNSTEFFHNVATLALQAAEALEHAHELGVVHRDIKPGNLLLDLRSQLWVTDFGLAKVQSDAALTMSGDLLGTLRYASPEQALAKHGLVDHRTDLYSLGATLYELLTLEPPFGGRDREELLRQIAFEEPLPPRRRNKAIPVDLETIVLKAMAKPVEERYTTAHELAADLRRFLEHKPIHARQPTLLERAAKWSRRHKAVATSAIVLLVMAAVGLAISTALIAHEQTKTRLAYEQIAAEQVRTKAAYEAEAQQRALADENFQQARRMLDFFTQVSAEELADKPALQEVRRKLLEKALEYYQGFVEQRSQDPSIQAELAASHMRVATILNEIGSQADAMAAMEQARKIQEQLIRDHPTIPEYQKGLTSIYRHLGGLRGGDQLALLAHKTVQDDLKLSVEQVNKINSLWEQRHNFYRDSRNLAPEERHVRFEEEAAQAARDVQAFLQSAQSQRLKQIGWQQQGPYAFGDSEVAEALRLTGAQREQIRGIQEAARPDASEPPRRGGHRPDGWKKSSELWQKTKEELLNVLTAEQKAKWQEMLGESLELGHRWPKTP